MRQKLVAGNWKMNGSLAANDALMQGILAGVGQPACDVAVCVPSVYLSQLQGLLASQQAIALGSQNVSQHENGPYTGDVSAEMLKEFGVRYAIVGHSERRMHQAETDTNVAIKAKRALEAGITPIVCVGETQRERDEGMTDYIVRRQLAAVTHLVGSSITEVVVAYEPVWAIGTGNTATPEQAQQVHAVLRKQLQAATNHQASAIRLLYGGSMNAGNAAELLAQPDIDGGLIGGAALKADDFLRIIAAAQ